MNRNVLGGILIYALGVMYTTAMLINPQPYSLAKFVVMVAIGAVGGCVAVVYWRRDK